MTLSSSVGWPLNGPSWSVRRWPLISVPKDERQEQQPDAGRRPGVLVAAQPAVGADHDAEGRGDGERQQQPDELDLGEPEGRPEEGLGDEVLRQPLHEQQRDAAEHRDGRQQDLVGPAAGQDLGDVGAEQRAEVDQQTLGVVQRELAVHGRPERHAADGQGHRHQREQAELQPARPRPDRPEDARERRRARCPRGVGGHPSARSRRIRTCPICSSSPKPIGATPSTRRPLTYDPLVLPRSSRYQLRTAIGQDRVLGRGERVVDDDRVVDVTAERRDDVEPERVAGGRFAARRFEDDQAPGSIGRFAGRRAQVAQQRADDPVQEEIEEGQEQQPDGPQHQEEAVHQSGAPATSTTSAVSPTSSRSPTPRTTSVTGTPLTRDPFVLPRSE